MAWKTPAGKQQKKKKNGDASFPGLKAAGEPLQKTHYQELQENEVMVLQAIYGEDFTEHKATHGAWKVRQLVPKLRASESAADATPHGSRNPSRPSTSGSRLRPMTTST